MEWFQKLYRPLCPIGRESANAPLPASIEAPQSEVLSRGGLPSTEGLTIGILSSVKTKSRGGLITCSEATERRGAQVYIHQKFIDSCHAVVGDRLAFSIWKDHDCQPQASPPIWKHVANSMSSSQIDVDAFPAYTGILRQIVPSGECGSIESPAAREIYGREVYIHKALIVDGKVTASDVIAFNVRVNGKGNPQAASPIFKMATLPSLSSDVASRPRTKKNVRKMECSALMADWAIFPEELLPRVLAASGPVELCRHTAVCCSWREVMKRAETDLNEFWKALCFECYPVMAAKISASELDDLSISEAAAQSSVNAVAAPDLNELGRVETSRSLAAESELGVELCQASGPVVAADHFWRDKFVQRFMKQREWDTGKQEQQRLRQQRMGLHHQQVLVEDKQRGQNFRGQASQSDAKTQRTLRSVRMKACRRCGERFLPGANVADSCSWHRGQYISLDNDGLLEGGGRAEQARVQQAIKAHNRKKKSRQAHLIIPFVSATPQRWAWSCCGSESMVAPGCASGPHT